jgi:hypothetical protein
MKDLEAAFVQQFEDRDPVNAGRFHDDRFDAALGEPIGKPVEVPGECAKALNRIGCPIRSHRRHVHRGADIDRRRVGMHHRHP